MSASCLLRNIVLKCVGATVSCGDLALRHNNPNLYSLQFTFYFRCHININEYKSFHLRYSTNVHIQVNFITESSECDCINRLGFNYNHYGNRFGGCPVKPCRQNPESS